MKERNQIADPVIDQLESAWWDQNAETVEAIWALPENIRSGIRSHYLKRTKEFFLESNRRPLRVLEVGCGSGWVGRMIADLDTINVVGIDLSERQIEIARLNAVKAGLDSICEYRCQNLAELVMSNNHDVGCVLIHAILHHLSWQEIHAVLEQVASLGSETRVFVYEPVYLGHENSSSQWHQRIYQKLAWRLANLPARLGKALLRGKEQYYNQDLGAQLQSICEQAKQNGWVVSPKEVVFQESEMLAALGQYFQIRDRYLCNYTSMEVGQLAGMYNSSDLPESFCKLLLPFSRWSDRLLFETGVLPQVAGGYVFMGYECVVK